MLPDVGILLLVMLAGAGGAVARLGLTRLMLDLAGSKLPWGTLVINLSGALFAGLFVGGLANWLKLDPGSLAWQVLVFGFLGSFTTVSSLSLEWLLLLREGRGLAAWMYLGGTLVGGISLALAGLLLAGHLA
ncbi:MAG: hypothetical protein EA370_09880 [Wenzhouxiangella sp.]|nr:MAG: hypothetical protein EA370_09880 [Wenzhouxiangella sp.]